MLDRANSLTDPFVGLLDCPAAADHRWRCCGCSREGTSATSRHPQGCRRQHVHVRHSIRSAPEWAEDALSDRTTRPGDQFRRPERRLRSHAYTADTPKSTPARKTRPFVVLPRPRVHQNAPLVVLPRTLNHPFAPLVVLPAPRVHQIAWDDASKSSPETSYRPFEGHRGRERDVVPAIGGHNGSARDGRSGDPGRRSKAPGRRPDDPTRRAAGQIPRKASRICSDSEISFEVPSALILPSCMM